MGRDRVEPAGPAEDEGQGEDETGKEIASRETDQPGGGSECQHGRSLINVGWGVGVPDSR